MADMHLHTTAHSHTHTAVARTIHHWHLEMETPYMMNDVRQTNTAHYSEHNRTWWNTGVYYIVQKVGQGAWVSVAVCKGISSSQFPHTHLDWLRREKKWKGPTPIQFHFRQHNKRATEPRMDGKCFILIMIDFYIRPGYYLYTYITYEWLKWFLFWFQSEIDIFGFQMKTEMKMYLFSWIR